ncbi:MAG: hypothetical protein ACXW27_09920 [Allosphingosinicella sp.]
MIELLLLAPVLLRTGGDYEPPPELFYHQAVSCAASLKLIVGKEPSPAQFADMMTWGVIMADTGRKIGRSKAKVDSGDLRTAEPFYRHLREKKPKAFAAHRAYCQALFNADRP